MHIDNPASLARPSCRTAAVAGYGARVDSGTLSARLLSAKQAAAYCCLSPKTLANLRSQGAGPAYTKPGRVYYDSSDLLEWRRSMRRCPKHLRGTTDGDDCGAQKGNASASQGRGAQVER